MEKKIEMYARFKAILENGKNIEDIEIGDIEIGGFDFSIGEKEIPFDFDVASWELKGDIIECDSVYGTFFTCHDIDNCFDGDYKRLGLSHEDITAKFLASAEKINDFHFSIYPDEYESEEIPSHIMLISISFVDETGEEYFVKQEVLDAFNEKRKVKFYEIKVTQQIDGTVTVKASSEDEALEKVNEAITNGDCFWGDEEIIKE